MVDKIVDPNFAARAYGQSATIPVKNTPVSGNDGGVSFSQFLENTIQKSIDTVHTGEKMQGRAVTGEADLTDVVQAVTDMELTVQTIVALRDRMVSAYQEILRMPI
jgi:flagellar hook-basal body complex protein FliE